eukprot:598359_1
MISMSSCTRVYHRSSIWITNRVRMGSENKWIRLAAMYSILLLYSCIIRHRTHRLVAAESLLGPKPWPSIHIYRPGFIIPHPDLRNGYERMVTIIRAKDLF